MDELPCLGQRHPHSRQHDLKPLSLDKHSQELCGLWKALLGQQQHCHHVECHLELQLCRYSAVKCS